MRKIRQHHSVQTSGGTLLLLVLCSALLSACGGTGSGPTTETTPQSTSQNKTQPTRLSKPQFVKQANMICREGLEEKERVVQAGFEKLESSGNPASKKAAEGLAVEILDPYRTMDQRLSELPPPQKDRMAIKRMIRQLEAGLQEAEQDPGTVVEGNPFLTAHESAKAYGLKACAF